MPAGGGVVSQHEALMRAAQEAREAMIRVGIALRPALERMTIIAKQPAFQYLAMEAAMLDAAMRYQYADDLCEPEDEVFV